jgi:LysR family hydrogen peroxide-inducible transcriptional activator
MQVQKLEKDLGILIFDRKKQPIEPTNIGRELIGRAKKILREIKEMQDFVKNEKDILEGELRIGIIPTLAPYLVPLFLSGLLKNYPKLKPIMREMQTEDLISGLYQDKLDIGILVTPLEDKSLYEMPIFEETFVAYLSETHPLLAKKELDIEDLDKHDLWILNEGHCFRSQILNICQNLATKDRQFVYESGSLDTLRKMVELNFGYTLLPQLALSDIPPERWDYIRYFKDPQPARQVSLVVHHSFLKVKILETLQKEILDNLPKNIHQNPKQKKIISWK